LYYVPNGVIDVTVIPKEDVCGRKRRRRRRIIKSEQRTYHFLVRKLRKICFSQVTNANKVKKNQRHKRGGSESDVVTQEQLTQDHQQGNDYEDEEEFLKLL
jgi:hypothetical protein